MKKARDKETRYVVEYSYVTNEPTLLKLEVDRSAKTAYFDRSRWNGFKGQMPLEQLERLTAVTKEGAVAQELERIDQHVAALKLKLAKLEEARAKVAVLDLPEDGS